MAEFIGGALLSAFLQALFEKLAQNEKLAMLFGGNKSVVDFLDVLRSVTKLVDDAEEKLITDKKVRDWLDDLQDMVYRADDLVDTMNNEAQRHHQRCCLSIPRCLFTIGFDYMVKNEATEIRDKFKSLLDQKDNLGLRDGVGDMPSYQRPPTPLAEESRVYGRTRDKEAIVDLLLSSESSKEKLSVISIIGMGGIGKTTLAQLVYDDAKVKDCFNIRAWVTVSDDFDIKKITKIILEKVTSEECRIEEFSEIQRKLRDSLREKKFLMVLDDVWNEAYNQWDSLKSSFESEAEGCKIIVTTRSTEVASLMAIGKTTTYQLADLSNEDCWKLFSQHAFRNDDEALAHPDLQAIGREIVTKCKGLPLAIKSLGGLLHSERNRKKWENILESDAWNKSYGTDILPALWLSYRRMPTHLKRCFSYCSIFKKDYEFRRERIIWLWMAEGFLESDKKSMTMEEVGEEYLEDLVSRSMFQKSSRDDSIFLMHDLVHDLAVFVSRGFCFREDKENDLDNLQSRTRHLSLSTKPTDFGLISKAKYLRTCISPHERWSDQILRTSGRYLRVLFISGSISKSIKDLTHLRYLELSNSYWCEELPASICSLYNLQTLLLSGCRSLRTLPKNMERLINLRHLDNQYVEEMNFQIKNMKFLLTLSKLVVGCGDRGINIKELKHVQPFIGRLEISRIENVGDVNEALEADLKGKKSITNLDLQWSGAGNATSSEREREILGSLQPHTNVRYLRIENYRGTKFPNWVGDDSFSNIVEIRLEKCKNCCILPPLGQLPYLKDLVIKGFDSVVSVGDELYGSSTSGTCFGSLETLDISDMPQWKEWSFGGDGTLVFPHLKTLKLSECPELSLCLPKTSDACHIHPDSLSKLEFLDIYICEKLKQWDLQKLSSLKKLLICGWEGDSFPGYGILLPTTLAHIHIKESKNLSALNGEALQQLTNLNKFEIWRCRELQCLPKEGLPASLSVLEIWGCHRLLEKRCKKDKGQDWHKIAHIPKVFISTSNP